MTVVTTRLDSHYMGSVTTRVTLLFEILMLMLFQWIFYMIII